MQQAGDEIDPVAMGLGYTCRKGLKPESPNQDSWFVLKFEGNYAIYGVFDGHGQKGHDVSQFVKENLPKLIVRDARFKTPEMPVMLKDTFKKCQGLISTADRMKKLSAQMSGTTCTVCIHDIAKNKITIAHVADSTAVLGKIKDKGNNKATEAVQLTRDHKPNLKDERARIEKNGGRVVFDGYANHRIYAKNARYPGLNMSRCMGDLMGHQDCGITAEPEVMELDITPEDHVLLLCSDGVWEFITPSEAVTIVNDFPATKAMVAAERLAKEAWDRWIKEEGGAVVDDITVVLVYMQTSNRDPM
jgi:serine/threonine protein phosphatase PrpC